MAMTLIRGLLEAAMTRGVQLTPPAMTEEPSAIRRGFAYVCRRCDVYGYLGPDDDQSCWSCERPDSIERR
jgi:hypothetical protein